MPSRPDRATRSMLRLTSAHRGCRAERAISDSCLTRTARKPESWPRWNLPAELHAGTSAALARAAVHPPSDGDETELARPVVAELDEAGHHQIDGLLVPQVHLHDPPPAIQVHYSFLLGPARHRPRA